MNDSTGGRIIVGVDGSDNSHRALIFVADLARVTGWPVVAVHAVGLLARDDEGAPVPAHRLLDELAHAFTEEWCEPLRSGGVDYECIQAEGEPVEVLQSVGREKDATLCVVGRRGSRPHAELVLGSTSLQLVESSSIPVLVVPPSMP